MPARLFRLFACTTALFALACTAALAQNFPTAVVLPVSGTPAQMVTADFNHDGHADIAYQDAYTGGNLHVLLGRGDGTFSTGQVIALPGSVGTNVTVGDVNGDDIPDLVFDFDGFASGGTGAITVLLGKGDGTFSNPISSPTSGSGSPVTIYFKVGIADFDGDGHPDIVYSSGESLYFMKGDGSGKFAKEQEITTSFTAPFAGDVLVADLNGDGLPDIVVSGESSVAVILNKSGTLTLSATYPTNSEGTGQGSLGLADIDGDGHPDIFFSDGSGTISVLPGHADGTFGPATIIGNIPIHILAFLGVADLHGDHKPRIIAAGYDGVSALLGATPSPAPLYAAAGGSFYEFFEGVIADFNGDGYTDIAMPGDQSIVLLFGKPDGTFAAAPSYQTGNGVGQLTVLDDTGDNIPDVILSDSQVFAGNGDGTFAAKPLFPHGGGFPFLLYSGDFDGNGHLGFYANDGIYHNDGDGTFTPQSLLPTFSQSAVFPTYYAAIADFNRDGRADVALSASEGGPYEPSTSGNAVYIENSTVAGSFTTTTLNFAEPVGPLGAGDFDGDGCLDLAVGAETQIEIFKGDCKGNFTQVVSYLTGTSATLRGSVGGFENSLEPSDMVVTDLDGDGHLDIVYTIPGLSLAKTLYGRGDGTFVAGPDINLPHSSIYVTTADLDSDGHPDLIFTGHTIATIYHGNGTRTLGSPAFLAAGYETGKAVVADLNRDGNPDIVIPNLSFDGGDDDNDNGFTFTVFLNPLAPRATNILTTTLSVAPEPSSFGQSFTATATFTPLNNPAIPAGNATFSIDGNSAGSSSLSSSGVAMYTFNNVAVGTHNISVTFSGDSNFQAASASRSHVVTGVATNVTLTSLFNPSTINQLATFTTQVTSANGIPTGTVTFTDGANTIGVAQPLDTSGNASIATSTLTVGLHTITATYTPTGTFAASTAALTQRVNALADATTLTATPTTTSLGSSVTLTATITPIATGTITFISNGATLGSATLINGVATLSTTTLPLGTNQVVATYSGDNTYAPGTSNTVPIIITARPSTLIVVSATNPSPALTPIAFTVRLLTATTAASQGYAIALTITPTTPGASSAIGTQLTTNSSGTATYNNPGLLPGQYLITATFAGTSDLLASTATSFTETVTPNPTVTTLTASPNPGEQNDPITFTATVNATTGTAAPAGTITLLDTTAAGITTIATLNTPLFAGTSTTVTFTTSTLPVGVHSLVAVFGPATGFVASQSQPLSITILPQSFTLTLSESNLTLQTGHHHTLNVTLTSIGGLTATFTHSCGALPQYVSCLWGQASVILPADGTVSTTLDIDTNQLPGFLSSNTRPTPNPSAPLTARFMRHGWAATAFTLLPFTLFAFKRRRRLSSLLSLFLLATLATGLTACGADKYPGSTPPGTYVIPITASAHTGTVTYAQTVNLTLIVTK